MTYSAPINSEIDLRSALNNISTTLMRLGEIASDLDDYMGDFVSDHSDIPIDLSVMQEIDLLRQSIFAVGQVVSNISSMNLPPKKLCTLSATEGVLLEQIRLECVRLAKNS